MNSDNAPKSTTMNSVNAPKSTTMNSDNAEAGPSRMFLNDDDDDDDFVNEPEPNSRSVYMITYSRADLQKVPNKEAFAEIITEAFNRSGAAKIKQYICCIEKHKDGAPHYHICIKLDRQKKWKAVRKYLDEKRGIKVNFRDKYSNYYAGFVYASKEDKEYVLSEGHPDLTNPPRTAAATEARRQSSARKRRRSFDALDLSELVVRENIRTKSELLRLAQKQKSDGKRDLALFVLNNIDKCVKIIETTWEMEAAEETVQRTKRTRMDILQEALLKDCPHTTCKWLQMAKQTLLRNGVDVSEFSASIKDAVMHGRAKKRNIMIVGPANCGKTFLFQPLRSIFNAFVNPATGSFAWVGVEEKEIIYLNDFRWNDKIIPWQDLLRLLEGDSVHFPAPKTHYTKDILLTADTPVFATSIAAITRYQNASMAQNETKMMEVRWKTFVFHHQISSDEMLDATPCGKCFAKLILEN